VIRDLKGEALQPPPPSPHCHFLLKPFGDPACHNTPPLMGIPGFPQELPTTNRTSLSYPTLNNINNIPLKGEEMLEKASEGFYKRITYKWMRSSLVLGVPVSLCGDR